METTQKMLTKPTQHTKPIKSKNTAKKIKITVGKMTNYTTFNYGRKKFRFKIKSLFTK